MFVRVILITGEFLLIISRTNEKWIVSPPEVVKSDFSIRFRLANKVENEIWMA